MKRALITQYGGGYDSYSRVMILEMSDNFDLHNLSDLTIELEADAAGIPWKLSEEESIQSSHFDIRDDNVALNDYSDVPTIRINVEALQQSE